MVVLNKAKAETRKGASEQANASSTESPQSTQATITSAVAADPTLPPTLAAARLFPPAKAYKRGILRFKIKEQLEQGRAKTWNWHNGATHHGNAEPDDDELQRVREMYGYKPEGQQGSPSRLYLMILADALLPLPRNPMSGVVSPPLLATTGIVPCSIFSTGPDIIEHYCDCIVAAKREVILLTNYWQGGKNVQRIADALRELNKRVQQRADKEAGDASSGSKGAAAQPANGTPAHKAPPLNRIVVKIMWDRGPQTLADLFRCRKPVPPNMWKSNGLPTEDEVPHLHVEILNYHRPLMGTFHAKLLLVDRQVALINSNNIQDRPNVEACTRLEGDIVNSIYDHALISWGNALQPPLPCLGTPAPKDPSPSAFVQGEEGNLPVMSQDKLFQLAREARRRLHEEDEETELEKHNKSNPSGAASPVRRMSFADVVDGMRGGGGMMAGLPRRKSAHDVHATEDETQQQQQQNKSATMAARNAGAVWASKALGGQGSQTADESTPSGVVTPPRTTHFADLPQATHDSTSPQTPGGGKRHFADVVEAMMKKEGIKPGLWAEGALDTLGLGPSSSRNVADQVRRSRELQQRRPGGAASHGQPRSRSVTRDANLAPPLVAVSGTADGDAPADEDDAQLSAPSGNEAREPMSNKLSVPDASEGAPGSVGYRRQHRRTLSSLSKASASQRLAQITKSLDFANLSQVKGEIKANELGKFMRSRSRDQSGAVDEKSNAAATPDVEVGTSQPSVNSEGAPVPHAATATTTTASEEPSDTTASTAASPRSGTGEADAAIPTTNGTEEPVKDEEKAALAAATAAAAAADDDDALLQESFAEGASDILDFQPYLFHARHDPVPMALMNRRPHGTPGHSDIRNPQDAAWLAGFRYAKEHIFIQSPTLNATPIKAAVLAAARRHVRVELWLDLGFNDKSESMPFQGGTNEQVVTRLYRQLRREGKGDEKYLEVYWYTGKDMTRPLNAVRKQRNCHVKYAAFDHQVAILGSGNQDTQSWFHSQEINVCVDSKQIVREWDQALRRNQSTGIYGKVDSDGIWRGRSGAETADTGKE